MPLDYSKWDKICADYSSDESSSEFSEGTKRRNAYVQDLLAGNTTNQDPILNYKAQKQAGVKDIDVWSTAPNIKPATEDDLKMNPTPDKEVTSSDSPLDVSEVTDLSTITEPIQAAITRVEETPTYERLSSLLDVLKPGGVLTVQSKSTSIQEDTKTAFLYGGYTNITCTETDSGVEVSGTKPQPMNASSIKLTKRKKPNTQSSTSKVSIATPGK